MKVILTHLLLFSSIFLIDAFAMNANEGDLEKIKQAVKNHISSKFSSVGTYKSATFGELEIIKPKEIKALDQLLELKRQLPTMKANYGEQLDSIIALNDSNIILKKESIRAAGIYHYFKINHLFTIKPPKASRTLYEIDILIYPNYKIKDLSINMKTTLSAQETDLFHYFIDEFPLIEDKNSSYMNLMNNKMHNQLSNALINAPKEKKEAMLHQVLKIVQFIRENNKFDADLFCAKQIKNWIQIKDVPYKLNYRPGLYTRLKTVDSKNTIMYHKLSHQIASSKMTSIALSFEFDPNYFIVEVKQYNKDFEKFFN